MIAPPIAPVPIQDIVIIYSKKEFIGCHKEQIFGCVKKVFQRERARKLAVNKFKRVFVATSLPTFLALLFIVFFASVGYIFGVYSDKKHREFCQNFTCVPQDNFLHHSDIFLVCFMPKGIEGHVSLLRTEFL
jgi:hypothetical protein